MFLRISSVAILVLGFTSLEAAFGMEQEASVRQLVKSHCIGCHGEETQAGKVALHKAPFDFTKGETSALWLKILEQLKTGDMPPPDEENQPSDSERNLVIEWIDRQLLTAGSGEAYRKKLLAPEYGNWVDHEKLFSGEIQTLPFSPSRLWRFRSEIFAYKNFGKAKSPFTYITSERGIRDYAAMSLADQSTVQMTIIVADAFLAEREKRGDFKDFANDKPMPGENTLQDVIRREFLRVIGRYPTPEEQNKYLTFLKQSITTGGNLDGLRTTIKAMFLSAPSIYRMEFGQGEVDEHGRRHLSSDELAHALAFALTDKAPDQNKFIREALQHDQLKTKHGRSSKKICACVVST